MKTQTNASKREQRYTVSGHFGKGEIVADGRDLYRVADAGSRFHEDATDRVYTLTKIKAEPRWTATLTLKDAFRKVLDGIQEPGSRGLRVGIVGTAFPEGAAKIATWTAGSSSMALVGGGPTLTVYGGGLLRAVQPSYDDEPIVAWLHDVVLAAAVQEAISVAPQPFEPKQARVNARFDRDGFDHEGWNRDGLHRETETAFGPEGLDREGYDKEGRTKDGFNRDGLNREGFSRTGYDREGYDRNGFNSGGRDRNGFDRDGYDQDGFNRDGLNRVGRDREGRDSEGYDRNGFNREGWNREGWDRNGLDRNGNTADGTPPPACVVCNAPLTLERQRQLQETGAENQTCGATCKWAIKSAQLIAAVAEAAGVAPGRPVLERIPGYKVFERGEIIEVEGRRILAINVRVARQGSPWRCSEILGVEALPMTRPA